MKILAPLIVVKLHLPAFHLPFTATGYPATQQGYSNDQIASAARGRPRLPCLRRRGAERSPLNLN